jgi:hypothetical protein
MLLRHGMIDAIPLRVCSSKTSETENPRSATIARGVSPPKVRDELLVQRRVRLVLLGARRAHMDREHAARVVVDRLKVVVARPEARDLVTARVRADARLVVAEPIPAPADCDAEAAFVGGDLGRLAEQLDLARDIGRGAVPIDAGVSRLRAPRDELLTLAVGQLVASAVVHEPRVGLSLGAVHMDVEADLAAARLAGDRDERGGDCSNAAACASSAANVSYADQ